MRKNYTFIAILDYAEDGINIVFPNIPEAISCAEDTWEATENAKEVLYLCLESRIKDGEEIPVPTGAKNIHVEDNQKLLNVTCRI